MTDVDAIGSVAAGGLVAREFAGAKGRHAAHGGVKQDACPNCGTPTPGHYCPECGQHAHLKRSVRDILHEAAHGLLHLDGKFWRTLPLLLFRPGRLTRNYIDGCRARYVAPFGIFLFTIFGLYFTFAFVGAPAMPIESGVVVDARGAGGATTVRPPTDAELSDARAELAKERAALVRLRARRDALAADADALAEIDAEIRGQAFAVRSAERALRAAETGEFDVRAQVADAADLVSKSPNLRLPPPFDDLGRRIEKAIGDPEFYFYKVKQSAYKFSFLLLPLSLPFVWLLFFWRRDLHL